MTWREVWGGGYGGGGSRFVCGQMLLACVNSLSVSSPPLGEDSESATVQAEERGTLIFLGEHQGDIMQLFLGYNKNGHLKLL